MTRGISIRTICSFTAITIVWVAAPSVAMADLPPVGVSMKIGEKPAMVNRKLASGDEASAGSGGSYHPAWVTDMEAKAWPGFLTGLSGYEDFIMPVSNFIYFEDPFITTDLRLEYVYHDIPDDSVLRGGQAHVIAAQIRIALSERWAFLATKDGYSWVDSHVTSAGDGWNDITIGFKYAVHSDPDEQFLVSAGLKWEWNNGSTDAFQGGDSHEINPFLSFAKGWDKWHFLGTLNARIPTNRTNANASILWNLHLDYKMTEKFRPLIEVMGIHWLTNADRLPFSQDFLDVGSLGASKAAGTDFFSASVGFRYELADNISFGLTYEFPLESAAEHLMQQRVTVNTVISF